MTVKELRESLNKYADDTEVIVTGGEDEYGEWAQLEVGHYEKVPYNCKGEIKYSKEEFFITEAVLLEWSY